MIRPALRLLAAVLTFVAAGAAAQTAPMASITGRAVDADTGEALPGVVVYLSRTTLGAAAGSDGRFSIRDVPAGTYEIVASMLGYERVQRTLVVAAAPVVQTFALRERSSDIGEALVVADTRAWRSDLRRFERLIFGTTPQGRACSLVNPEVLDFADADGAFSATAAAPLVLENRALGYRVTVALDRFRAESTALAFGGATRYEALTPESPRQLAAWEAARQTAYRGSLQHFLRAVARGTAAADGFEGYLLEGLDVPTFRAGAPTFVRRVVFDSLLVERRDTRAPSGDGRTLAFGRMLHVEYAGELAHPDAPGTARIGRSRRQHSVLHLAGHEAAFHAGGYFLDPYSAETFGYWAWEGLPCDLLPLDYVPADER